MYSKGGRDYKETGRQLEVIENYPEGVKKMLVPRVFTE
jgi:hypothetical protein